MGTHCGWPRWACHPPRCLVLSTIRLHCTAASAPAHSAACSGVPPLLGRTGAGRGQRKCPKACPPNSRPILPDISRRCPCCGGHFASPWPPPHYHLFLIYLYSLKACLPSPTQHQTQLVLIKAGGEGRPLLLFQASGCSAAPTSPEPGGSWRVWVCSSAPSTFLLP